MTRIFIELSTAAKQAIIIMSSIVLLAGIGIGVVIGAKSAPPAEIPAGEDTAADHEDPHFEDPWENDVIDGNEQRDISSESPRPQVNLVLHELSDWSWAAQLILTNFEFAPESSGADYVAGEGHAHIYLNGVKLSRVYSEWFSLGELEPGNHNVEVRLSGNDHSELTINGQPIGDSEVAHVHTPEERENPHSH